MWGRYSIWMPRMNERLGVRETKGKTKKIVRVMTVTSPSLRHGYDGPKREVLLFWVVLGLLSLGEWVIWVGNGWR